MKQFASVGLVAAILFLGTVLSEQPATAFEAKDFPYPGVRVIHTGMGFGQFVDRLNKAVEASGLKVVERASASGGAAQRGVKIPGNMVVGVFRNDYAVRMLATSVPAGIEAPLRFYVTEEANGTATLTYRTPSAVFKPYRSNQLDAMAKELDGLFDEIARSATK